MEGIPAGGASRGGDQTEAEAEIDPAGIEAVLEQALETEDADAEQTATPT